MLNFGVRTIFGYADQPLHYYDGRPIIYHLDGKWDCREYIEGEAWYMGRLLFQTRDCIEMCHWLNLHVREARED